MQVSESNPMVGIEGRTSLLFNLGKALKGNTQFFGIDARPGNIVGMHLKLPSSSLNSHNNHADFLEGEAQFEGTTKVIPLAALWHALIEGLNPIWPSRLSLGGISLGDVWPCPSLKTSAIGIEGDELVPFHKLTMWLSYSLVEVLEKHLKWRLEGVEDMTGLPEYRNGTIWH